MEAAGPAAGPATCAPLPFESWELTIEHDIVSDPLDTAFATSVIALPHPDSAAPTVFTQSSARGYGVLGFDGASGAITWELPAVQHDVNGLAGAYARSGTGWLGIADLTEDVKEIWLSVADLDTLAWVSSVYVPVFLFPFVVDLGHSGVPTFVTSGAILSRDAAIEVSLAARPFGLWAVPFDRDGFGTMNVANSYGVWAADGTELAEWEATAVPESRNPTFMPAVVQVDGELTVAGVDKYGLVRFDLDGTLRWFRPPYDPGAGEYSGDPPAVGDATGDGVPDLCASHGELLMLVSLGGVTEWTVERQSQQGTGGCSMADIDADGVYEVVDWGRGGLFVRDGRTGTILAERTDIRTSFWMNPPIIADVDDDGSMEIVASGRPADEADPNNSHLYVLGAAEGRWARGRPVWNQTPYDITTVRDDGTLVSFPFPSWQTYNAFRAQPAHDGHHPDLVVEATDACANVCGPGGTVRVSAQVSNLGSKEAPAGSTVRLLTWTEAGGLREVAATVVPDTVPSMRAAAGVVLEVPWEDWGDQRVMQIDGDLADECDRVNDRIEVDDIPDPCGE